MAQHEIRTLVLLLEQLSLHSPNSRSLLTKEEHILKCISVLSGFSNLELVVKQGAPTFVTPTIAHLPIYLIPLQIDPLNN